MRGRRILVVDDSKTQRVLLQMALEKKGFEVIIAEDGLDGVTRAYRDSPDLIISDIQMPELNGYQLCRLLKNDKDIADTPIILLTCLDQPQDQFWGIRAGADRYLVKSSDYSVLMESISLLLREADNRPVKKEHVTTINSQSMDWQSIKSSLNHLLDKLLFKSTLSNEARRLADYIHSREKLLSEVCLLVKSLIDYSCLCISFFEEKETQLYLDLKSPLSGREVQKIKEKQSRMLQEKMGSLKPGDRTETDKDMEICFLKNSVPVNNHNTDKVVSSLSIPLNIHNECLGYLSLYSTKKNIFNYESDNIIQLLSTDLSMVFKLMLLYGKVRNMSITDSLTGLNNNRYFKEIFNQEFERARRFNNNMTLIFTDIDNFKSINDRYGHLQGDSVLKDVATILKQSLRKMDFAARYGGEEFAVLAIETDMGSTSLLAERIRKNVECHPFKADKKTLKITISLGVATLTTDTRDMHDLIRRADEAMYRAKESGRNRVCMA